MNREQYLSKAHNKWKKAYDLYHKKKMTFDAIGKKMGCTRQWASKMVKNYEELIGGR